VQGKVAQDNFSGGLAATAEAVYDLPRAREICGKSLLIKVNNNTDEQSWLTQLQSTLTPFREGITPLEIEYNNGNASTLIRLSENWKVTPTDTLLSELGEMNVVADVKMRYERSVH
jgi:DNA polymerase-3 subunit alpha